MSDIIEKFSRHYRQSLKSAADLAWELNHQLIEPEHIFYGLVAQQGSVGAEIFAAWKIKLEEIKNQIAQDGQAAGTAAAGAAPEFSDAAKNLIQKSVQIAYVNRHRYVGTEHLLAAIIQTAAPAVKKILDLFKISEKELSVTAQTTLKSVSKLPDLTEAFRVSPATGKRGDELPALDDQNENLLEIFGTNLNSKNFQQKIDPLIGREKEISRLIEILCRRTKNNPIILGRPGVGKTALAEGLAERIAHGQTPAALKNKKIYALDLAGLVAGTIYRGEFESRLKQIAEEIKNRPEVILFIDEIHNLVGAGSASGSMDAANILKPALARGEIRCIGATTFEDYRKSIESDPALDRRFQPIKLNEPTAEEAKAILQGLRSRFENFHQVRITDEAIAASVDLSQKYLHERFLPDKAIDLMDEASAAARVNRQPSDLEKKLEQLNTAIQRLEEDKKTAIEQENFNLALELKNQLAELQAEQAQLEKNWEQKREKNPIFIEAGHIAKVVAKITGLPAEELTASEKKIALKIDKKLKEKIIGQDQAIAQIAELIKRAKAGLTDENKPLASLLFVGPSGVGKTYTAKTLAELLFQDHDSLIKIDMSEYSERFNVSKLIGAPAGYVGYKESGQLTEKVKHRPYSVVLFDEMEKANPEIFDLLLQIMEDGYLTDAAGSKINFRQTIVIMTSNIGSAWATDSKNIGFEADSQTADYEKLRQKISQELKNHFKPELLGRLDRTVFFKPLMSKELEKICQLETEKLNQRLRQQQLTLEFSPALVKEITQRTLTTKAGARGVKKIIQETVEGELAEKILAGEISPGDRLRLDWQNSTLTINRPTN